MRQLGATGHCDHVATGSGQLAAGNVATLQCNLFHSFEIIRKLQTRSYSQIPRARVLPFIIYGIRLPLRSIAVLSVRLFMLTSVPLFPNSPFPPPSLTLFSSRSAAAEIIIIFLQCLVHLPCGSVDFNWRLDNSGPGSCSLQLQLQLQLHSRLQLQLPLQLFSLVIALLFRFDVFCSFSLLLYYYVFL